MNREMFKEKFTSAKTMKDLENIVESLEEEEASKLQIALIVLEGFTELDIKLEYVKAHLDYLSHNSQQRE